MKEFQNTALLDYAKEENARAMRQALEKVRGQLGREYPLVIGGERATVAEKLTSTNPARPSEVVGVFQRAGREEAERAIVAASKAFLTWRDVEPAKRADFIFRAADILRKRRHEFSAWLVYEAGKTWPEADGDTAEAIDFLDFYAREMLRYAAP